MTKRESIAEVKRRAEDRYRSFDALSPEERISYERRVDINCCIADLQACHKMNASVPHPSLGKPYRPLTAKKKLRRS